MNKEDIIKNTHVIREVARELIAIEIALKIHDKNLATFLGSRANIISDAQRDIRKEIEK